MNKIYQTIQLQTPCKNKEKPPCLIIPDKGLILFVAKTGSILLMTALYSNTFAQTVTYDGTNALNTAQLEVASSIGAGLPAWMKVNNQGLIYRNAGNTVTTKADLIIDYTTGVAPNFIIGGYSDNGSEVKENTVTIKNGAVDGSVYGGLSHTTEEQFDIVGPSGTNDVSAITNADLDDSNATARDNKVIVENGNSVTGSVYGSNATILAQGGNTTPGDNPVAKDSDLGISSRALSRGYARDTIATAEYSSVRVGDDTSVGDSISGGYANITATAGTSDTTGHPINFNRYTDISASSTAVAINATVTADHNGATMGNNVSVGGDVYAGHASLIVKTDKATAGVVNTTLEGDNKSTTTSASGSSSVSANRSTITATYNYASTGDKALIDGSFYGGYANMITTANEGIAGEANIVNTYNNKSLSAFANSYATNTIYNSKVSADWNMIMLGNNATVNSSIYGGYANIMSTSGTATGGISTSTSTNDQGSANSGAFTWIDAEDTMVTANSNSVLLSNNASVGSRVYGGYANLALTAGTASAGQVDAKSSTNSASAAISASGLSVTANYNSAMVENGATVSDNLYGSYASIVITGGTAKGGIGKEDTFKKVDASIDATNNKVSANSNLASFNGILQNGSIYGGYAVFEITQGITIPAAGGEEDNSVTLTGSKAQAIKNMVSIRDNARFNSSDSSLYGGYLAYNQGFAPESYDVFTDNSLNYSAKNPARFNTVANFENYYFTLNPVYVNTDTALITADTIVLGADASNNSNGSTTPSTIRILGIRSGPLLYVGDEFSLMQALSNFTANGDAQNDTFFAQQGISLLYDIETNIDETNKKVTATVVGCQIYITAEDCPARTIAAARVNPQLKALSEGRLASAMLVTRGADTIAYNAFNAINAQKADQALTPFIITSGDHVRYNSGSHIKSNDFLLTGGLAYQHNNLTAAAFIEGGWGNYDSHNSFSNAISVNGDGHSRYYGVGAFGHYDFNNGIYTDSSLRFGRSHNTFSTDILNFATGEKANYKLKNNYMSAHIGVGHIKKLNDKDQLDLSAKYLWTTLGGKKADVTGDPIHFKRINSQRVRLNGEMQHQYNNSVSLRGGLGYEYEFDSKAKATTYDIYQIKAPRVKGSTGIVSLGTTIKPITNQKLTLDIDTNGYLGKRKGFGGSLKVQYAF